MSWGFDYMLKDTVLATVTVNEDNTISLVNYTDDIIDRPFGVNLHPSMKDLENLFEERVFPRTRFNAKQILKDKPYGYDPIVIIGDTHGILVDDLYWIRFDDEKDLTWDKVKHWKYNNL